MDGVVFNLALVFAFVLFGGFFAAAELALVSLRDSQVRSMVARTRSGRRVAGLRENQNRMLSAVQVGVTFSGFMAASYGGATIAVRLESPLESWGIPIGVAGTVALLVVTLLVSYISLVFGELVPKRLALQRPETVSLFVAPVLDRVATLFRPVIWFLSKSTDAVVRLLRLDPRDGGDEVSEEELRDLVSTNEELTPEERKVLRDVFHATDRVLREVMVPRTEVDFLPADLTVFDAARRVTDQPHSRYPVVGESIDDVLGFVHVRDLLTVAYREDMADRGIREVLREVPTLPGSLGLVPALSRMRRDGRHIAVVVDEYGGTDGIVTLEDLVEELVGDIQDEYDPESVPDTRIDRINYLDGLAHRDDVSEATGVTLPDGSFTTLGGFVMTRLGRVPAVGDGVVESGHRFTVTEMEGRRVARVVVAPVEESAPADTA